MPDTSCSDETILFTMHFQCVDVELLGVHVPRPRPCQRIQYEPHHTQTMAGKIQYDLI